MAKKNARDEPPKPQVIENEQISDIVFILDKMELILETISQIGKDEKFNMVFADKQHRNSFLKIDRYADAFENFIKNFWSQLKDLTRFGISREYLQERGLLEQMLKGYNNQVVPISVNFGSAVLRTDARLSFQQSMVGEVVLGIHCIREKPDLDRPYF